MSERDDLLNQKISEIVDVLTSDKKGDEAVEAIKKALPEVRSVTIVDADDPRGVEFFEELVQARDDAKLMCVGSKIYMEFFQWFGMSMLFFMVSSWGLVAGWFFWTTMAIGFLLGIRCLSWGWEIYRFLGDPRVVELTQSEKRMAALSSSSKSLKWKVRK